MGLPYTKEEQLRNQPIIQSTIRKSADGKFIIHRTTITHIKPVSYYEAVLANSSFAEDEENL